MRSTRSIQINILRRRLEIIGWMGVLLVLVAFGGNITDTSLLAHLALTIGGVITTVVIAVTVLVTSGQSRQSIRTPMDWAWLALVLVALVSALLGPTRRDIEAWVFPLALQLPFFYGIVTLRRRGLTTENWLRALLIVTAGMSVWAMWLMFSASRQWIGLHPPAEFAVSSPFRLYGILDNPNVLGAFLAISIPLALGYTAWTPSLGGRIILLPWLILVGVVLIATGSRTGQMAALISSAATILLIITPGRVLRWARQQRSRQVIVGGSSGIVLIAFVGLLIVESGAAGRTSSGVQRLALWQTALTAASSKPILGIGMGNFPIAQLQSQSVPPIQIERHAHNLYLNVLAESGFLGLGALLFWVGCLGRAIWQKWRAAEPSQRALISGLTGALLAFGLVGLLDDPMAQAAPLCIATILAALISTSLPLPTPMGAGEDSRDPGDAPDGITRAVRPTMSGVLLLGSVAICIVAAVLTIHYSSLTTGEQVEADTLDQWQTASQTLDIAAAGDPSDPLVQAQAGVAWANVAALGGVNGAVNDALDRAIAYYRIVVRLDPASAIHHLNLGALLMRRGQYADALPELAQAASSAPDSAVTHLNYGIGLEQNGQTDQAIAEYRHALALEARWRNALFWQATVTRKTAWQTASGASELQTTKYLSALQAGDVALQAERPDDAAVAYAQAAAFAPDSTARALAGGMVAESRGDLSGARYDLQSAVTLGGEDAARAHLYLGDLDNAQNNLSGMLSEYLLAFQQIDRYGVSGPGSAADITYAVNAYGRYGYIADYLPGVTLLDMTPDLADRFITLAKAHVSAGDKQSAAYIYRRILEANPGYDPAESGLAALE